MLTRSGPPGPIPADPAAGGAHSASAATLARKPRLALHPRTLILVVVLLAAVGIRLPGLQDPPLNFQATRQYRSLLIARGFYYDSTLSAADWRKQVADASVRGQGILEPPLLEHLVALLYRAAGGEALWIPKVVSSSFWIAGGIFLLFIARRIISPNAAVIAASVFLLLPFGVVASRSVQPDPLMIMLLLASILATLRYWDHPSRTRHGLASLLAALAFLAKPVCLFALLGAFVAVSVSKRGLRASVLSWSTAVFVSVTLLPTLVVYVYGVATGTFLSGEAEKTVLPQLLLTDWFWRNWLGNIGLVVGFSALIVALLGTLMLRQGAARALMLGLWTGYGLFCVAFNYNVATHDYYQLQLVPIVALGIAPVGSLVLSQVVALSPRLPWRIAPWGILGFGLLLALALSASRLANPDAARQAAIAQEIGAQVGHSTRTIILSGDYGVPLEYHGELSGSAWPIGSDLEWDRLAGVPPPTAEDRFQARFAQSSPEYFIITDLREFDAQPDLKQFLSRNFRLLTQTPEYLIFDLRGT